jgi:hypothetical protein
MALVYRNGRPRLQRSIRRGGRVTTEYRGSGEFAVLFALMDAEERAERDAERDEIRVESEALDTVERALDVYFEQVEDFARAALYAAGYHRPKREWRKRRERSQTR